MINKKGLMPYFENLIPGPTPTMAFNPTPAVVASSNAGPPPAQPQPVAAKTKIGAKGKEIPVGQFGNRLDTAAGRAKEAKMQQQYQIDVASHALGVASAQRAQGQYEEAEKSAQLASQAANQAAALNRGRAEPDFFKDVRGPKPTQKQMVSGTSSTLEKFRRDVDAFNPFLGKPADTRTPDGGGDDTGDDDPEPRQPTTGRITAPITAPEPPKPKIVKNPNRDVLDLSRDEFSISSVSRLLFEQVGSIELVNIARRDTIEGQNPYYSMISNLSTVRKNFDPTSIITRQKSNQGIYSNYSISLNDKIPDDQYLERNNLTDFYYIDDNGDLVIELDNLASDEIIDFEIAESGTINLVDEA